MAEIEGVPEAALRAFSQRRAQVLDYLERQGSSGFYAAKVAALETRDRKEHVDLPRCGDEWRARAAEHGLGRTATARASRTHRRTRTRRRARCRGRGAACSAPTG